MAAVALFFFSIFAIWAAPLSAQSQSLTADILKTPPWGYYKTHADGSQTLAGLWPPVAKELEKRTGVKIVTRLSPYARIQRNLQTGRSDLTVLILPPGAEKLVEPAGKVFEMALVVLSHKDRPITSLKQLAGKRVGVIRGLSSGAAFEQNPQIEKEAVRSYQILVEMFLQGRLDYIAGANLSLGYHLKQAQAMDKIAPPLVLGRSEVWLMFSKKSRYLELVPLFGRVIEKMAATGRFDQLLANEAGALWNLP